MQKALKEETDKRAVSRNIRYKLEHATQKEKEFIEMSVMLLPEKQMERLFKVCAGKKAIQETTGYGFYKENCGSSKPSKYYNV